ncbi:hypothetical protein [Streptomyces sp. NPDC089919]|uniref:hypothetical protein n=1 Tax=Streptomyces sp. NPDC089919 TaxID=3155188 RepID=UPI00342B6D14
MGIESDQLVYDYLSRVGDLAQRSQLPSGDRMRLVSTLRNEIDRQRAKFEPETPASVRRILDRLGPPEEVVAAAGGGGAGMSDGPGGPAGGPGAPTVPAPATAPAAPAPAVPTVPAQRGPRLFRKSSQAGAFPPPRPSAGAAPPHLAGLDELGDSGGEPDWWRAAPPAYGPSQVAGFAGGIEIPELLKRPPGEEDETEEPPAAAEPGPPLGRLRTVTRALRERRAAVAGAAPAPAAAPEPAVAEPAVRVRPNTWLLLCAVVLVGGAVSGSWLVALIGWALVYGSQRLSSAERKWVVLGLPGLVLTGAVVWVWGRSAGRWGEAIPPGGGAEAFTDLRGVLLRLAAALCAGYLLWRSRRV